MTNPSGADFNNNYHMENREVDSPRARRNHGGFWKIMADEAVRRKKIKEKRIEKFS